MMMDNDDDDEVKLSPEALRALLEFYKEQESKENEDQVENHNVNENWVSLQEIIV